ncbi:MAG: AAA family ATPase [Methanophagales archaeon]|nr:AAA family ATPase [Methanophagales archaeon]
MIVTMWIEKYRPKRLNEIVGHDAVVRQIQGFVKKNTTPNLVLWGPKGTGKTSIVYALAKELYGEFYDENLMHVETADFVDQGKKWLKENKRLKFFYNEQKSGLVNFKAMIREYSALSPINTPFKLLFFSNADLLPRNAQQALRRIIEESNRTCRFIFATTKPAGIIPAIRSRCLNLHFRSLDKSGALDLLTRRIADAEKVTVTDSGLKTIKDYARGNAVVAITILEAAAVSVSPASSAIDEQIVEEVAENAFFRRAKAEKLIDLTFAARYTDIRALLEFLIEEERISGKELLVELHEALRKRMKTRSNILTSTFAQLVVYEGEADLKICSSLNTMIPLEEMLVKSIREISSSG